MKSTADRIKEIIAGHPDIKVDVAALKNETNLHDHVGADGLFMVDLSLTLEDEFSIVFRNDEIDFETVGDLIAAVERKLQDKLPRAAVA